MTQTHSSPTYEDFLRFSSIQELEQFYYKQGFQGPQKYLLKQALQDWKTLCIQHAEAITQPPSEFLPEIVEASPIHYHIYGLIHGLAGGDVTRYKAFVSKKIGTLEYILFENGLNYFYAHQARAIIPDFMLFGIWGSFVVGFKVGLQFPLLILLLLKELFKPKKSNQKPLFMTCDPLYHAIDPETRRGLDDYPSFPTRLQVHWELEAWNQKKHDPSGALVVPRSLFMASFAQGFARSRNRTQINLVVGDLHTLEVAHFLKKIPEDHKIYQLGYRIGSLPAFALKIRFFWEKIKHLSSAGVGGVFGFLPYFFLLGMFLLWRMT